MNLLFLNNGIRIGRDRDDPRIRKESTIVYYILKMLNSDTGQGRWVRFYPYRHGLTDSRLGVRNIRTGEIYWHANYQVEDAAEAFNEDGQVFFHKA